MTHYDPQKHHRRSMRLKGYNYAQPGAYFITLVAYHRDLIFGQVVNGEMQYSALGQIAQEEWLRSNDLRREICLNEDEFIVMPNHIHGIVWIVDPVETYPAEGLRLDGGEGARRAPQQDAPQQDAPQPNAPQPVGADGVRPMDGVRPIDGVRPVGVRPIDVHPVDVRPVDGDRQPGLHRLPRSLSSFVAGYKSVVTGRAGRELEMTGIWQRNYYDHIIRNEGEFRRIWDYIDTNPERWQEDQLHPEAPPNRFNQG